MRFNPTERLREHSDNYKKTGERINMDRADDNNILFVGCGEWREPLVAFLMEK